MPGVAAATRMKLAVAPDGTPALALHDAFAAGTHNGAVIAMSRSLARVRDRTDWGRLKARGLWKHPKIRALYVLAAHHSQGFCPVG